MTQLPQPPTPPSVARYGTGVPKPPPKAKTPTWVIVGVTVLAVCCVIPMILGTVQVLFGDKTTSVGDQSTNAAPPPPAAVVTTDTPPPATSAPPQQPPAPAGPATSFGPGMYEVGVDIKAGTYTCTATGFGGYWERAKNASGEFDSIITNELVEAGAKSIVTVKVKEFFKVTSMDCVIR